jgi:hypothetical protein
LMTFPRRSRILHLGDDDVDSGEQLCSNFISGRSGKPDKL